MAFIACQLIPLYKKPGVQPVRVGDVPWRIITKAVIGNDIQLSAGALQTCAGHDAGSEAAILAMRAIFEDTNTHTALLVDTILQMLLILLTAKLPCTISLYCVHPFLPS